MGVSPRASVVDEGTDEGIDRDVGVNDAASVGRADEVNGG